MSRSATVTLTFVGDTSQLDQVYESFVRKASKPIAVPLTGGAGASGSATSSTTFANASVPGAVPAPAVAPGVSATGGTPQAVQQVTQAYANLATAVNQQAATVVRMTQGMAAGAPGVVPGWPGNVGAWAVPGGGGAGPQPVPPAQPPQPQPQPPPRPVRPPLPQRPTGVGGFGRILGAGAAANILFSELQAGREYGIDSVLAGNDQRAQLDATLKYRRSVIGAGSFVGEAIGLAQDPSGMAEAGIRATLGSSEAIDARTAALGGYRRQTQNLRDQVSVAGTATPLDRRMAELDVQARRDQEKIRADADARAKLDEADVRATRISLDTGRRRRANASFGTIAGFEKGNASVFVEGQTEERDRREAVLAGQDATAVSGMAHEREQQRNAATRTNERLAGERNYLDVMSTLREDAPRRAAVHRMAEDVDVFAARGARRFQAASRMELEADVNEGISAEQNPFTREVRRQRGAAQLSAFDANQSFDNQSATRVANLVAESIRRATAGDAGGALESRQFARRRATLDRADFSTPGSAAAYEARRQEDVAQEGSENQEFAQQNFYRSFNLQGAVRSTGLAARGQNTAAQAQGIFDRGRLGAYQEGDKGRFGDALSQLSIATNELAALRLNYEKQGTGAEFGAGTLSAGGTQGNVTLEDMSKTLQSMTDMTTELGRLTAAINAMLADSN